MKVLFVIPVFVIICCCCSRLFAQTTHYYIDVHHLGPGKVTATAVADAHAKDLAIEKKYGVQFIKYWVDESAGNVYCLSSAQDTSDIRKTHAEAHGLLPDQIYPVTSGKEAKIRKGE